MPSFDQRTSTVTRHEYVLDGPTNAVEVTKMLRAATQDLADVKGAEIGSVYDDEIKVVTEDDSIVAYWEEQT